MNADKIFLLIAEQLAQFSKCRAFKMCALIVKNGKIISTGINGTPSNTINCCDIFKPFDPNLDLEVRKQHHDFADKFEIHAELNAIINAAFNGINVSGGTMYITNLCCFNCLKHIIAAGIKRIVYKNDYDKGAKNDEFIDVFLKRSGVELIQFKNS